MNILTKLTAENLKKNRRRTIMTVMGTILSTALILAVAGMVSSLQEMMRQYAILEYGDYHDMFEEVPSKLLPIIENNPHAKISFYSKPLAANAENIEEYNMELYEQYQTTPIDYTDLIVIDWPEEVTNVFVRYDEPAKYQEYRNTIQDALETENGDFIRVRTNKELLRYEGVLSDTTLTTLYSLMAIVIAIIIVTSIFAIRNSFSISANERTKQFGMLGSIGATPKQIRRSVITEGMIIAAIGIPLGIVAGMIALAILVVVMNMLMEGLMLQAITVATPFWIFVVAIVLGIVTIFLSSLAPAIRAGRMSPVEALKGSKDVKINPKKIKTNRLIAKCFGIGGTIAHKNLQRSRKKYRTTVISIVVAVATFIGLSSFMNMMSRSVSVMYGNTNLDLMINGATPKEQQEFIKKYNFTDYAYYQSPRSYDYQIMIMNAESFEKYARANGIHDDFDNAVLVRDYEIIYEDGKYVVRSGGTYHVGEEIETSVLLGDADDLESDCEKYERCYAPEVFKHVKLKITKIVEDAPVGLEASHFGPIFVISENSPYRDKLVDKNILSTLYVQNYDNVKETYEDLEKIFEERSQDPKNSFFVYNIDDNIKGNRSVVILIGIFLYGFLTVVTLIGVTSIFNVITTNIALRAKELAMLRSIGMTRREMNRMVRLESLFYTIKSVLIGLPLGVIISYLFYQALNGSLEFAYELPLETCAIATLAVAILIFCIMKYSVRQVEKQNIIETLREENV